MFQCLLNHSTFSFALHLITMSKRSSPLSAPSAKMKGSTSSSAKKLETQVPLICKDTCLSNDGVLSFLFGISSHLGAISRAQEVLLDRIESTAQKVEILRKEVQSMKAVPPPVTEMKSPDRSWLPSDEEIRAWLNSPIRSPIHGSTMDLTCSETLFPSTPRSSVHPSMYDGYTDHQEWVNQELRMQHSQKHM